MQNLKRNFILIGLIVLFGLSLLILPAQAADNDILVYSIDSEVGTPMISDIVTVAGYNIEVLYRTNINELGLTNAFPINLLDYGQIWIINNCDGDATDAPSLETDEITALEDFRNNHNGGLLLSVDHDGGPTFNYQERINPITRRFNNNINLFYGSQITTPSHCISPSFTWAGYPTKHALYFNLTELDSSNSDAQFNIQNPNIEITAINGTEVYGAVLDEAGRGKIVFDNAFRRFWGGAGFCSAGAKSQYQLNVAKWLKAISSPSPPTPPPIITPLPPISGGLIPCGRKTDNPDTPNVDERDECTVCHFFLMIKNIMDFITKIAVIVAILFIAIGGIMYVLSTGNEAMLSKAKAMITYAIIGFILIFAAWLMIELILSTFGYTNPLGGEWDVIC